MEDQKKTQRPPVLVLGTKKNLDGIDYEIIPTKEASNL